MENTLLFGSITPAFMKEVELEVLKSYSKALSSSLFYSTSFSFFKRYYFFHVLRVLCLTLQIFNLSTLKNRNEKKNIFMLNFFLIE